MVVSKQVVLFELIIGKHCFRDSNRKVQPWESTPASTWFLICPRQSLIDNNWGRFIDIIKEQYKDDARVEIKPNYIVFKAEEHPILPFEGHKFLHFSSKVSGAIAAASEVESYIDTVTLVAKAHFGSHVQYFDAVDFGQ